MVRTVVTQASRAVVLVLAVALGACTPAQAPAMRISGKVMALGGVAGIVGSAFAINVTDHAKEMLVGFEVISAVGIVSYAYAEITWPRVEVIQETPEERHHRWAKILTERAAGAARDGRCPRVRRLEPRVQQYDRVFHDLVFMKDPEIVKCLRTPDPAESPPGSPAESPPPGSPSPGSPAESPPPGSPSPGSPSAESPPGSPAESPPPSPPPPSPPSPGPVPPSPPSPESPPAP